MKPMIVVLAVLMAAAQLPAQTGAPVKLALLAGTDEASAAVDLLTARLSADTQVELLERDEIDKVYHEQGLSAANTDYLKLGRVLGADGLVLFDVLKTGPATNLTARLVAVKPGVILTDESFPWPMGDLTAWGGFFSGRLESFLPKLKVSAGEAIPISVVNFHSSVSSDEARETERQLKLLAIQRLTREKRFFVLERQKMDRLGEEKELAVDDSTFWDGSYLLEGTVDQNGYAKDTLTIDGRLTPKGGQPLMFQLSGSRTNEAEIINQLVLKVNELLKVNPTMETWDAAAEAERFYKEGQWALRWGMFAEARSAADSAWALGKRDMACATLRIHTCLLSPDTGRFFMIDPATEKPDPQYIALNCRALGLYLDYSRQLPSAEPMVDSDWYGLGLENLTVASRTLQVFNWSPEYYQPIADQLAELRAKARAIADWISKSPTVHDSYYYPSDRTVSSDDLIHFEERPNIYRVELECGCLWQERPEDTVALYRQLMSSPVFRFLHVRLWFRNGDHNESLRVGTPRLVAWNETDLKHLPAVWAGFMRELDNSPNPLWQLEAQAIRLADATNGAEMGVAFTNFFDAILRNRDALISNRVEVLYMNWGIDDLLEWMGGDQVSYNVKESWRHIYHSAYESKLGGWDDEYKKQADDRAKIAQFAPIFEGQKQYLATNAPYDFFKFNDLFLGQDEYSKEQARELQPWVATYRSNLVVQSKAKSGPDRGMLIGGIMSLDRLSNDLDHIINPYPAVADQTAQNTNPAPKPMVKPPSQPPAKPAVASVETLENATNLINVRKFLPIPLESLIQASGLGTSDSSGATVTAHHWVEGRLLLNFDYHLWNKQYGGASGSALAILDPVTEHWEIVRSPGEEAQSPREIIGWLNRHYHRSTLFRGELYDGAGGQIKKYDFAGGEWKTLEISDGNDYELFPVNGHLYAANSAMIFEIVDGGASTHILASTRRQPPMTALDARGIGTPILFAGPNHSLRVSSNGRIFTWTGSDWHDDCATPPAAPELNPELNPDGILYRQPLQNMLAPSLGCVATETAAPEQFLWQKSAPWAYRDNPNLITPSPPTVWQMPPDWFLSDLPAAISRSNLYLLADFPHSPPEGMPAQAASPPRDTSVLLCFSRGLQQPQTLYLKFDLTAGYPPRIGIEPTAPPFPGPPSTWMMAAGDFFFFGHEQSKQAVSGPFDPGPFSQAGVWLLPRSRIESVIAQLPKPSLGEYDLNHNGIIDAFEREAAVDDPDFIKSQLDLIDTNQNGRLDLEELVYFDANQNKVLEPHEAIGIKIAQQLLAARDLKTFDDNGHGYLNQIEFHSLCQSGFNIGFDPAVFWSVDENHDQKIDAAELANFLTQWTRQKLQPGRLFSSVPITSVMFKDELEAYWHDPTSINRPPPRRHLTPERMQEFLRTHHVPDSPAQ